MKSAELNKVRYFCIKLREQINASDRYIPISPEHAERQRCSCFKQLHISRGT